MSKCIKNNIKRLTPLLYALCFSCTLKILYASDTCIVILGHKSRYRLRGQCGRLFFIDKNKEERSRSGIDEAWQNKTLARLLLNIMGKGNRSYMHQNAIHRRLGDIMDKNAMYVHFAKSITNTRALSKNINQRQN